jgi:hypothetical protein
MGLARPVQILGVNEDGYQSGNTSVTSGRDLPWLQDVPGQDVWTTWAPAYRDVVILGPDNSVYATFNLTTNNLANTASYEALRDLFVEASEL